MLLLKPALCLCPSSLISSLLLHPTLQMMGKTDGDNFTLDDMFVSSVAQEEGEGREEERMRNRAIRESRRMATSMDKCQHCFSSQELQKHLVVAIGSKVSTWMNVIPLCSMDLLIYCFHKCKGLHPLCPVPLQVIIFIITLFYHLSLKNTAATHWSGQQTLYSLRIFSES